MGKWLITGAAGFIGTHLCSHLAGRHEVLGTYNPRHPGPKTSGRRPLDVLDQGQTFALLDEFKPDCVVHLAGSKDVNWCEKNPQDACRLNTESVSDVASACERIRSFLIFLSSDYVFDGTQGRYPLQSACRPLTVYGKTKLDAEQILVRMNLPFAIVRTGGVYARSNPTASFLGWAGSALKKREPVSAFENVFNSPTYVADLLDAIEIIGSKKLRGIFHLAGASRESRYSFLVKFAKQVGFQEERVEPSWYSPAEGARRPLDISLDSASSYQRVGFEFRGAIEGLRAAFNECYD